MFSFLLNTQKLHKEISDNDAENYLLAEKWHCYSGYADLGKIKHSILNLRFYHEFQKNLIYYCTEDTVNNILGKSREVCKSNLRKIIRTGVPMKFTREMLLKLGLHYTKKVLNFTHNI